MIETLRARYEGEICSDGAIRCARCQKKVGMLTEGVIAFYCRNCRADILLNTPLLTLQHLAQAAQRLAEAQIAHAHAHARATEQLADITKRITDTIVLCESLGDVKA